MSENNNRPTEIHFRSLSAVDRAGLPLLSSMVDGEIYAAEMLNARGLGIIQPGIFCGYKPKTKSGLTFTIAKDAALGYSAGLCEIGLQQFHIIQQHDIDITVQSGYKWIVVLEAFYQQGVQTTQVTTDSDISAASVKAIREYELIDEHQIICEIDLTSGKMEIELSDFDMSNRNDQDFTIGSHVAKADPHTQYPLRSELDELVADTIGGQISQNPYGNDPQKLISEQAVKSGLSDKANTEHSHDADDLPIGNTTAAGIIQLVGSYNSSSVSHAPTARALKEGLQTKADASHSHNASDLPSASPSEAGLVVLSNSYTSTSESKAATPHAVSAGLKTKSDKSHKHDAGDLPEASTTAYGIVKRSDNPASQSSDTVASSKALDLGLRTKGDKNVLVETSSNITITRRGQITTILRTTTADATITIDASTFTPGDELVIINAHPESGVVTIRNADGKLYDLEGLSPSESTLSGQGRATIIRVSQANAMRAIA